jgi:hypothetical protein
MQRRVPRNLHSKDRSVENLMCVPSPFVSCTLPAHLTSNQPNQETIAVDANEADLLSSTAATRAVTRPNLEKMVSELVADGGDVTGSSIQPVLLLERLTRSALVLVTSSKEGR